LSGIKLLGRCRCSDDVIGFGRFVVVITVRT